MTLDRRLTDAIRYVADGVTVPEVDLDAVRSRAHKNRRRVVALAVSAVVGAIIVAGTVLVGGRDVRAPELLDPVRPPGIVTVGPVWYDAAGLHHGDVVDETPVGLFADGDGGGVLALVRAGAMYLDPANDDVWFHPWNGRPHVVGHGSAAGPGGEPDSDVAAWFEGDELVVFDTAREQEISRTTEDAPLVDFQWSEHVPSGNGFTHVSAEEVVWRSQTVTGRTRIFRLDVETGQSTILWEARRGSDAIPMDVHGTTQVSIDWGDSNGGGRGPALLIDVEGRQQLRLDDGVEPIGRLSADGAFLLSPSDWDDSHGAAIVDVRSGEIWYLPFGEFYAWIAWSYGDLAIVTVDQDRQKGSLAACDALTRTCDRWPTQGNVLLPTS